MNIDIKELTKDELVDKLRNGWKYNRRLYEIEGVDIIYEPREEPIALEIGERMEKIAKSE